MSSRDRLREIANAAAETTIRQHRKVRRTLAHQRVPVLLEVTGGEFLDLQDRADAAVFGVDEYLMLWIRDQWKKAHGEPLGSRYEVTDPTPSGDAPRFGRTLRKRLGL